MTNYEWLVKQGKLEDFISTITASSIKNINKKYGVDIVGEEIYNPQYKIAEWLQEERHIKEYVALDEVVDIMNEPFLRKKEAIDAIHKLPRKEINDDE